jgi:hypothetical protein
MKAGAAEAPCFNPSFIGKSTCCSSWNIEKCSTYSVPLFTC